MLKVQFEVQSYGKPKWLDDGEYPDVDAAHAAERADQYAVDGVDAQVLDEHGVAVYAASASATARPRWLCLL